MQKMADLIEKHANDIAPLETKAMGMPLNVALFCVKMSADIFRCKWRVDTDESIDAYLEVDYAGWTDKIAGEQYPAEDGVYKIVQYEPLGVCAGIGAWNASTLFFSFKTAAAVCTGNTVSINILLPSALNPIAWSL
jgi:aldehyde dehydrogenase (NAD+)